MLWGEKACYSMCGVQWKATANKSAWQWSKYQKQVKYLKQMKTRLPFAFWLLSQFAYTSQPPRAAPLDVGFSFRLGRKYFWMTTMFPLCSVQQLKLDRLVGLLEWVAKVTTKVASSAVQGIFLCSVQSCVNSHCFLCTVPCSHCV